MLMFYIEPAHARHSSKLVLTLLSLNRSLQCSIFNVQCFNLHFLTYLPGQSVSNRMIAMMLIRSRTERLYQRVLMG